MRLTDEQQTSVDDALYPKMQPVTDYSADPGLGVYSPSTTQPSPDANNDGLNDSTGWAMGVTQDQSSPTGFSYNGQPTQSNGALYTAPQYGPSVQQDNAYQQAQNQYLGDSPNSGVYQDPGGNVWENGNWWNQNGEVWNDQAQSWLSPAQYNDFAQQSYDYGNAQAQQYMPPTYEQPGGNWYNYDQYKDSGTGWDTYNLSDKRLSYPDLGYVDPQQAIDKLRARGVYVPPHIAPNDLAALVGQQDTPIGYGTRSQGLKDYGYAAGQAVAGATSGEAFQKQLGIDTGYIDWLRNHGGALGDAAAIGVDTLTAPTTILGLGGGFAAGGVQGAAHSGAIDIVGNLGAQFGASDAAKNIPLFGDQPAWLRGIEGGVVGGVAGEGAYRVGKGFAEGISGAGLKDVAPPKPDLPTPGEVGPAPVRDFTPVNPEDIAFGKTLDTGASTGMRAVEPPSGVGGAIESLPNKTLAENFDTASKILAKLEDNHGHMVLNGDPQAPAVAAQLAKVEEQWSSLSDEVAKRLKAAGVTDIKALLRDESGQIDLAAVGNAAKTLAKAAAPIATRTALGAGVGAAYGEASGMGWQKGATIGAGVGAGFGVLGKLADNVASRGVEARLAKNAPPEATGKLTALVKAAKPIRENQEALYSAERARRAAIGSSILAKGGDARTAFQNAKGALAGELPKTQDFAAVEHQLSTADVGSLFDHLRNSNLQFYTKVNGETALTKVLSGQLPTRSEITTLGKVFGDDFAKALLDKRSLGAKAWENFVDAANLPRTLMTSWDASAPLRQGAILFAGHPIAGAKATGTMIRAMASPKFAELVKQNIETSPNATMYEKMGLYFADTSHSAALSTREEAIMSRIAGKIPGVGGSQRGYTTFLNKLRQDVADNFIAGHPNLSNKELKDFGHVINIMSGRGDLPKFLSDNSAILNAAFAPRYAMSRLQLPVEMVKAALPGALGGTTGAASKELARDVTAFVATGTTILTLGKLAGVWNVELDPRSTDFGKGKMGNTRFDFWAGEQQIARYAAQLVGDPTRGVDSLTTGQRKTSTGQIVDANRLSTIGRWLQTKKSPAVGFATDLLQGKDFVGNPIDLQSKEGIGNQAWQRLAPLFLQDMADAAKLSGNQWRALTALPSAAGAGVQTYQDSDYLKRQKWIQDNASLFSGDLVQQGKTPDTYANLSPAGKQLVDSQYGKVAPFSQEAKDAAGVLQTMTALQGEDDTKRQMGQMTPEDWRRSYTARKEELFIRNDQIYATLRDSGKLTSKNPDPILDPYYKAIEASKAGNGGQPNWDQVDAYRATLSADANKYIDDNTGLVKISTPETQKFQQDYNSIKNSGYFEKSDQSWQQVSSLVPTWDKLGSPVNPSDYQSYDAWRQAALQAGLKLAGKTTEDIATVTEINSWLDKQDPAKGQAYYTGQWSDQWVANNPKAAYEAWKYGYFNPKKEIKDWLAGKFE